MGAGNRTCAGTSKQYQLCRVQVRPRPPAPPPLRGCRVSPGDTQSRACPWRPVRRGPA